jgi:hypothetical protein
MNPTDERSDDRHPAEEIAELLGDPLPRDWRDPLAIEARAEHLAALAYTAADAWLALITHHANNPGRVHPDDAPVDAMAGAILELEQGLRNYTRKTQRGDGAAIVYTAVSLRLGSVGAEWIRSSIDRLRGRRLQRVAAIAAERGLKNLVEPSAPQERE